MSTTPKDMDIEQRVARLQQTVLNAPRNGDADRLAKLQHKQRVDELRSQWSAPKRHLDNKAHVSGKWGAVFTDIAKRRGSGFLVGLAGGRGSGKTQMAVELMLAHTWEQRSALYTTAVQFFIAIKATYRRDADHTESDVLAQYCKPSLLVIDEFGKRSESDWENLMLFELLNARYNDVKDTLLIDNRSPAEFRDAIGPSLASRMQETGGIIHCDWPSYRDQR